MTRPLAGAGAQTGLTPGLAPAGPGLRGTWGTVLLPIRPDQRVDFDLLDNELEALLKVGLAGVYTCGTAGEFHTLEEDEFDGLSEVVARKSKQAGVAFQIGASHMSGQICLSRVRRARALAPAAIQVVLPDWLPLSSVEVHRAVELMVATADPVPVVLYNPRHAKTVCSAEQLASLANELPGLVGVKVGGDDAFYSHLRSAAPRLSVFAPGHELAHARHLGAVGSYSNVACLAPSGALRWETQMDEDPDRRRRSRGANTRVFWATYPPAKINGLLGYSTGQDARRNWGLGTDWHASPVAVLFGSRRGSQGNGAARPGGAPGAVLSLIPLAGARSIVYCQHCSDVASPGRSSN